jgi:hypothetical protein
MNIESDSKNKRMRGRPSMQGMGDEDRGSSFLLET